MKDESKEGLMTVHIACPECGSGIHVYPSKSSKKATCDICKTVAQVDSYIARFA